MTRRVSSPHREGEPPKPLSQTWPTILLGAFALIWMLLAINPWYRQDWLLENVIVFAAIPLLVAYSRQLRFSNVSYALLFVFLCAHEIGAHYTYSNVPYDDALRAITGYSIDELFGFKRNQYDRFVHFLFGLLLLPLAAQAMETSNRLRGLWAFALPVLVIEAASAIFELIEWAAAVVFGGDLDQAYLGMQGDPWDAQCDMALALLGGFIAQCVRSCASVALRYGAVTRQARVTAVSTSDSPGPARVGRAS